MTSSDESEEQQRPPVPSGDWIREHRERLIEQAERADREDYGVQFRRLMMASEERQARFKLVVCGGTDEDKCTDQVWHDCEFKFDEPCPRNIATKRVEKIAHTRRSLKANGVSERVLKAVFDDKPTETKAVKLLAEAMERDSSCLVVLQGGVGCGKTCAAALWATRTHAHWITAKALARMSAYDDDAKRLERFPHLVIDDLGTEYADAKGFFLSNLDGLIDARYADELPTVITTNVAAEEFKQRYGARIADRIRGAGAWVEVGGASLRVRK